MKEQRQAESGGMLGKDISGLTGYSFNQGAVLSAFESSLHSVGYGKHLVLWWVGR